MADVTSPQTFHFHRKPVNYSAAEHHHQHHYPQPRQPSPPKSQHSNVPYPSRPMPQQTVSHSHTRTASSSVLPSLPYTQSSTTITTTTITNVLSPNRRTPSSTTVSSISSRSGDPTRTPSSVSGAAIKRSTSVRSGMSFVPTSYVALMRKQKATVWCDRAQLEDSRLVAAAKVAKHRAALEVSGGNAPRLSTSTSGGNSSLGVRGKISNRYNLAKPLGYSANMLGTTGLPMRLSATEVGDEEKDTADSHSDFRGQRTGSGRSSLQNAARLSSTMHSRVSGRLSTGSTPPREASVSPATSTPISASTTMVNRRRTTGEDYFQHPPGNGGSGSSGEEARFGDLGDIKPLPKTQKEDQTADDLSRRGSVDERAATMRGAVKLFVANPDLSD